MSDKYVDDAIKALDTKLAKEINYNSDKAVERLEKCFKEFNQRINTTNIFVTEKFDDVRKILQQYDSKLLNVAPLDKIQSVQSVYRDMKYNFEREFEQIQDHLRTVEDKIGELHKKCFRF